MTHVLQVSTTLETQQAAERLASTVVEERLAACAQVTGPVKSTYWWKGKVTAITEWQCHFKTTKEAFPALRTRIQELHPYDVPELIAFPVFGGHAEYLQWIANEVRVASTD